MAKLLTQGLLRMHTKQVISNNKLILSEGMSVTIKSISTYINFNLDAICLH